MMSSSTKVIPFRTNAAQALRNATLRGAMRNATDTFTIRGRTRCQECLWRNGGKRHPPCVCTFSTICPIT